MSNWLDKPKSVSAAAGMDDELSSLADEISKQRRSSVSREEKLHWQLLGGAADGNDEVIIEAITSGADVNFEDNSTQFNSSALMIAASGGHRAAVDILLLYGADKSKKNQFGQSARDLAHENGHHDIAQRLEFEENFNAKTPTSVQKGEPPVQVQVAPEGCKNERISLQLKALKHQLADAQQELVHQERRKTKLKEDLEAAELKRKEAEERSDKAAEVALDMQEELESVMSKKEELEEERNLLTQERSRLTSL